MVRKQFLMAWRNLRKNRLFTVLNLTGLSTGLACTLLIYLWVADELNRNKFNENGDRIYQVMQAVSEGNGAITNTPGLLAASLPKELPEVAYATAVVPQSWFSEKGLFSVNENYIRAGAGFVSDDFFQIFSCRFVEGQANKLFARKNNLALSRELAMKLFGRVTDVVGNIIQWHQKGFDGDYVVSGVFEKFPLNSVMQFDALFNYAAFLEKNPKLLKWGNNDPETYALLKEGADADAFQLKITGFVKNKDPKAKTSLFAQKFEDTFLYNRYENGIPAGGRIEYVKLFSVIAAFILLIACINFMNLSTANTSRRMKEVGIQKLMGASRNLLVRQYLAESLLMAILALLLAIGLTSLLLPAFKSITGKNLRLQVTPEFVSVVCGLTLLTGLIAGSYPSFYLSRFKPVQVLKGTVKNAPGETLLRKGLIVFQFTVSVVLIIAVLVVYQQMQLIEKGDLGYNRDHVIYFDKGGKPSGIEADYKQGAVYKDLETFLQQLKSLPGVVNASNFRHSIVNREGGTKDLDWEGKAPADQTSFTDIACGYGFIETLGIEIKEGRSYSTDFSLDKDKVILNEAAVKAMAMHDPVGKTVTIWGEKKQIIGVTGDFHFQSLHETIKPCFFDLTMNARAAKIIVRLKAGAEKATLDRISGFYKRYTGEAFDFAFLDEDYQALYAAEKRVAALSKSFAAVAVIISCLGLFGLASFTAQKRRKEIGIRKVVGASVGSITAMLSGDLLKLVLLSLVIAFPASWWAMNKWLEDFTYRINIGWWVFALAGVAALVVALLTVCFQAIKAAVANPIKNLRTE